MYATISPPETLVIFDLDGTIYRTETSFLETMRRIYHESDVPPPADEQIMARIGETFADFLVWLKPQGFSLGIKALAERIAEIEFEAIAKQGEAYPSAVETLRALRLTGYRLAICTNGDIDYAGSVLKAIGARDLFDAVKTFEDAEHPKSIMVAELQALFRPARTVMVGDRYHDLEAGRATGCIVVGATYGYARPRELDGADHLIGSLSDLPDLLASLG